MHVLNPINRATAADHAGKAMITNQRVLLVSSNPYDEGGIKVTGSPEKGRYDRSPQPELHELCLFIARARPGATVYNMPMCCCLPAAPKEGSR